MSREAEMTSYIPPLKQIAYSFERDEAEATEAQTVHHRWCSGKTIAPSLASSLSPHPCSRSSCMSRCPSHSKCQRRASSAAAHPLSRPRLALLTIAPRSRPPPRRTSIASPLPSRGFAHPLLIRLPILVHLHHHLSSTSSPDFRPAWVLKLPRNKSTSSPSYPGLSATIRSCTITSSSISSPPLYPLHHIRPFRPLSSIPPTRRDAGVAPDQACTRRPAPTCAALSESMEGAGGRARRGRCVDGSVLVSSIEEGRKSGVAEGGRGSAGAAYEGEGARVGVEARASREGVAVDRIEAGDSRQNEAARWIFMLLTPIPGTFSSRVAKHARRAGRERRWSFPSSCFRTPTSYRCFPTTAGLAPLILAVTRPVPPFPRAALLLIPIPDRPWYRIVLEHIDSDLLPRALCDVRCSTLEVEHVAETCILAAVRGCGRETSDLHTSDGGRRKKSNIAARRVGRSGTDEQSGEAVSYWRHSVVLHAGGLRSGGEGESKEDEMSAGVGASARVPKDQVDVLER
ncbi:hypothetical protein R3P38DRAFT_2802336 [Favolaschia claudopus]|uniref:Uncharacterized protein n=1 Tax=Favolaschia claudopus TaxID=2862362 RepID=A0AAV9ZUL4_9AGAR